MNECDIRIFIIERDFYARQAIISYLGLDRRTRVLGDAGTPQGMVEALMANPELARLDLILLDAGLASGAPQMGACGYVVRDRVGIGIAWAIDFALRSQFLVTAGVATLLADEHGRMPFPVTVLPGRRRYPSLTGRVEQALRLCVVEGLSAAVAADEMGISTSTVRSYIKEGYRILETEDDTVYPICMSPAERAFIRYTALEPPREVVM